MAQKKGKPRERQIGKTKPVKKHFIDPKYQNTFWTAVVIIILIVFFIVNNTRSVPDHGPYPPSYTPSSERGPDTAISKNLQLDTNTKK